MPAKTYKHVQAQFCSLCGIWFRGIGHNPEPLKPYKDRCCDVCNDTKVVPARIARMVDRADAEEDSK